jgi:hypothetical protein
LVTTGRRTPMLCASAEHLPQRPVRSRDQGQAPAAPRVQQGLGSVLKQQQWPLRTVDPRGQGIHRRTRETFWDCGLETNDNSLIMFRLERIVERATTRSRASQTMKASAMQAGTTPNKRTSISGRTALKLKRLDGARRADRAASDARVTKASSSIAVALLLISSGASATECPSSPGHVGKWWSYRILDGRNCWYRGSLGRSKDLLRWGRRSPPAIVVHPVQPAPCTASPGAATKIVDTTPKPAWTVPIPALTSKPLQATKGPCASERY